ncbi:MAG TPA: tetratricopeptide repeat protein [Pyrinomonadaceae bacterium]|nr:tetratricopeptide repeat protein [Pyrinomonadaceae bacterium]
MIGETISQYRIIEQLGEGGMGVVYLAEDLMLGRRVALKFLSTTTKDYRARFLREVRAVSALSHPNIATVYNYGETDAGQPYFAMELIEGQPLNEKLCEGSLPLPEAVKIVSYIAEALGEAHRNGIVHRDVKPSNVIITERGQVKVLDFGLVKQISEQATLGGASDQKTLPSTRTRSDMIVGTPLYLSPEQATGKTIDGRSDLFALGAVLYECITGQSAFGGGSVIEIGAQVIHVTPIVPSKLNDRIPPELDRITMKAIEKKVEARYQTADALIEDLQRLLPNLAADGYRRGRSTESLQKQRTGSASALTTLIEPFRRPGPNLGLFILALLGVALVCWGLVRWLRPGRYVPLPSAQAMYDNGTDALRYGAFLQATKALEEAVKIDSNYSLAHARLAEAWYELDYADKAKDEMLKAQPLGQTPSELSRADAFYLESIHATLTQDFPAAIKAHSEIVALSPNDPQAYVDLGRAYEKNDELQEALKNYLRATELAPQHATAYLRAATMYGKQINLAAAFTSFDRAENLYQASGNFEGQAEVAYQRGFLLSQSEKLGDAQQQLERALQLAQTTKSEYEEVKSLLKLGEVVCSEGHAEQGRGHMQRAIDLAQNKGIDNYVKRGLVDLGNTFMLSRDYADAEKYFKQSLELSQRQKDPRNIARALLSLGSVSERQNNLDLAVGYVEQALPFYLRGGYRRETIQAYAILARAKKKKGEYAAALQAFEQELKIAGFLGDQAMIARANVDIGLVLMSQARYPEALKHFEDGYTLALKSNNHENMGLYLTNRANALWNLGRYTEARPLLDEVSLMAAAPEGKGVAFWFYVNAARMALSERNFGEAKSKGQMAMKLDTLPPMTAISIVGLAQVLSGAIQDGRLNCQKAVDMATPSSDPLLTAEAVMALAQALIKSGDNAAALKASLDAQQTFARLGKPDYEWLAFLFAALARKGSGDTEQAREYASQAKTLLVGLQQRWGDANYQSYLSRPDIQFHHNQLNELAPKP